MTPEEADRFMAWLDVNDRLWCKYLSGNNGKREIRRMQGVVMSKNEDNFWLKYDPTGSRSPQPISPERILKYRLISSPVKDKYGERILRQ